MSEYQYYEFQAIDRPLDESDRVALRALSTRARITTTSFTNSYEWGDFKGDPVKLMENWFDLHLHLANWGGRRLMIRLPSRLVDRYRLGTFLGEVDGVELRRSGRNLILDIAFDEDDVEFEEWDDGSGWLAAIAPLRADVLGGDLRLFYLLWLTAVESGTVDDDEPEPMPGIGPMTGALDAFAQFFNIDPDLVAAAAERHGCDVVSTEGARRIIAAMTEREKADLLVRLFDGDGHVGRELSMLVRQRLMSEVEGETDPRRTVGELRARAEAIRHLRERAESEKAIAERKKRAAEAERFRRARLDGIARKGESVWQEIEGEIERRNAAGYDKAVSLLVDLRAIAQENGAIEDYSRRLQSIRDRHARKGRLIERLAGLG